MTSGIALLGHWLVCRKLNRISSVHFSYVVAVYEHLNVLQY